MGGQKRAFDDYDSSFEDDDSGDDKKEKKRKDLTEKAYPGTSTKPTPHSAGFPSKGTFDEARGRADSFKNSYLSLNAFERHRKLINDYFLYYPEAVKRLQRDSSKDKTDADLIRENHRFIWNEDDEADTWEKQLAKKYYDKLFKEYCIGDLSQYKTRRYAMRWRTEKELIDGKGQFSCGARKCEAGEGLRTWEVNFAYMEESIKKNALVKIRLCPGCSVKLNFHDKRKEVTKAPKRKKTRKGKSDKKSKRKRDNTNDKTEGGSTGDQEAPAEETAGQSEENIWKEPVQLQDLKTREEEFDEYLDDLLQ